MEWFFGWYNIESFNNSWLWNEYQNNAYKICGSNISVIMPFLWVFNHQSPINLYELIWNALKIEAFNLVKEFIHKEVYGLWAI